jgi:hypothetical protein
MKNCEDAALLSFTGRLGLDQNAIRVCIGERREAKRLTQHQHGIIVDPKDKLWLAGSGQEDNQLLKFTGSPTNHRNGLLATTRPLG